MYPVTSCSVGVYNYAHVVKSYIVSRTGQCFQKVFIYCTCCADVIEIDADK